MPIGNNQPKKSLGQHWLKDNDVLQAMVGVANVNKHDTLLEIGPGQGSLTKLLVKQAGQVVAVEFDDKLAVKLSHLIDAPNLKVISQDILKFNRHSLPAGYKIVANIPYYLTGALINELVSNPPKFSVAVLLLQKEVAQRICAKPGQMSILAVTTQWYCECQLGQVVPAVLFDPVPKVDSQIIILTYRPQPLFKVNEKELFKLVKAGFSAKRKTLENSLSAGLRKSKDAANKLLQSAGIDPGLRAQNLSLIQWYDLYLKYTGKKS